jgi:hypothetical protein
MGYGQWAMGYGQGAISLQGAAEGGASEAQNLRATEPQNLTDQRTQVRRQFIPTADYDFYGFQHFYRRNSQADENYTDFIPTTQLNSSL